MQGARHTQNTLPTKVHGQVFCTLVYGITPGIRTLARYHYIGQFFQNSVLVFRCLTVTSDTIVFYLYDRYKIMKVIVMQTKWGMVMEYIMSYLIVS